MSTIVYRMSALLGRILANVPLGTHLGVFWLLWALGSGRFLLSRGAVCPALADRGLPADAVRRSGAALAYGPWAIQPLGVSGCVKMEANRPCEHAGCMLGSRRGENARCRGAVRARRSQQVGVRRALRKRGGTRAWVCHPATRAFDDNRGGMRQPPIQDRAGQGAVMVADRGPLLAGTVGGHQQRPLGRAAAAHWEEQSGARLVNGAIAELVQDAPRGSGVFCEFGFEPARPLGRGQGVEASHGTGTAHRVPLAAGGIAPGGRQMRWPQAAPPYAST